MPEPPNKVELTDSDTDFWGTPPDAAPVKSTGVPLTVTEVEVIGVHVTVTSNVVDAIVTLGDVPHKSTPVFWIISLICAMAAVCAFNLDWAENDLDTVNAVPIPTIPTSSMESKASNSISPLCEEAMGRACGALSKRVDLSTVH